MKDIPPQLGIGLGLGSFAVDSSQPDIFCLHCTKVFPNTHEGRRQREIHRGTYFCRLEAQSKANKITSKAQPQTKTKKDARQIPFEPFLQDEQGSSYSTVDKKVIRSSEEKARKKEQRRREMLQASLVQLEVRQSTKGSSAQDTHRIMPDSRFQDKLHSSHDKKAIESSEEKAKRKEQRRREMLEASLTQLETRQPKKTSKKRKYVLTPQDANLKTLARDIQHALAEPRNDGHASKKIKL